MTEGARYNSADAVMHAFSGTHDSGAVVRKYTDVERFSSLLSLNSPELEFKVLGELMQGRGEYERVRSILRPGTFYDDLHRAVFTTIVKLYEEGRDISMYDVAQRFEIEFPQYADERVKITDMETECRNTEHLELEARELAYMAEKRSLGKAAYSLISDLQENTSGNMEAVFEFNSKCENIFRQNGSIPESGGVEGEPHHVDEVSFTPEIVKYAHNIAEVFQVSLEMVYTTMFAAVSAAVGSQLKLPYKGESYINFPSLSYCIVAPSSSNKSAPATEILRPLYKIHRQLVEDTKRREEEAKAENGKPENRGKAQIPMPERLALIIQDFTPEARNQALVHNPHGLMLHSDELPMFLNNANRYCNSGELQQLLNIMDNRSLTVSRKGEGHTFIQSPCMTIYGGIQPGIVEKYFGSPQFIENGFTPRWLFCFPEIQEEVPEENEAVMDGYLQRLWDDFIYSIYELDQNRGRSLELSGTARKEYVKFKNNSKKKQMAAEKAGDLYTASIHGKMQIHVLRLAMIIHVMGVNFPKSKIGKVENPMAYNTITILEMQSAIAWANYFESCALKVRDLVTDQPAGTDKFKKPTKSYAIQMVKAAFGKEKINQKKMAEALGIKQQQVNREFNR